MIIYVLMTIVVYCGLIILDKPRNDDNIVIFFAIMAIFWPLALTIMFIFFFFEVVKDLTYFIIDDEGE